MKVIVRVQFGDDVPWPDGWPPPRIGDHITVNPEADDGGRIYSVWYVEWDPAEGVVYVRVKP